MWLLKTDRVELRYFSQPPEKYAILSHVWGQNEQSFQDIQALACQHSSSSNPRASRVLASEKIRDCCLYAEADGYDWLWIDTSCIDKTSSAELSEAINSMYQWYAKASVCYVYLHDVSACSDPIEPHSSFRTSRWFTRGWTLQELIAPRRVLFVSCEWVLLGDKGLFSSLLQEVTGIDAQVLTFRTSLLSVPVATRMRWASQRMTTRVENEAYSLMGIFGVNMPTIYGEGSRAFRRLQEEIMKNVPDHTLFVWGHGLPGQALVDQMYLPTGSPDLLASSPADFRDCGMHVVPKSVPEYWNSLQSLLLATFHILRGRRGISIRTRDESDFEIPEFAMTSHGVRVRLPVISIPQRRESSNFKQVPRSIALLACGTNDDPSLSVGLLLYQLDDSPLSSYGVGCTLIDDTAAPRWVYFNPTDFFITHHRRITEKSAYRWKNIYLLQGNTPGHGVSHVVQQSIRSPQHSRSHRNVQIMVPIWVTQHLAQYGFLPSHSNGRPMHEPRLLEPSESEAEESTNKLEYAFNNPSEFFSVCITITRGIDEIVSGHLTPTLRVALSLQSYGCAKTLYYGGLIRDWPSRTTPGTGPGPGATWKRWYQAYELDKESTIEISLRDWSAEEHTDVTFELGVRLSGPRYQGLTRLHAHIGRAPSDPDSQHSRAPESPLSPKYLSNGFSRLWGKSLSRW